MQHISIIKKFLCAALSLLIMVTSFPAVKAEASSYDSYANITAKLDQVISQNPDYSYWTDSFDGASTCYGFAKMVIYNVFGKSTVSGKNYRSWLYDGTSTSGMNVVDSTTSLSSESMKNLLWQARPGDVLQLDKGVNKNQHSIIIYSVENNGVTIYESNVPNYLTRLHFVSFDYWSKRDNRKASLLRSDNYDEINGYSVPPVPAKVPTISLSEANYPSATHKQGQNFGIRGIVSTDCGVITKVYGELSNAYGIVQNSTYYPHQTTDNLRYSINNDLAFGKLSSGNYQYTVTATAVNGDQETTATLISVSFNVAGEETANNSGEPALYPVGWNMNVNVGKGSTLRFCSTVSVANQYEIGSLPNGATVYVYGYTMQQYENRTWAKISYNGTVGWVNYAWLS